MLHRHCCRTGQLHLILERWYLGLSACASPPSRNCHHAALKNIETICDDRDRRVTSLDLDNTNIRRFCLSSANNAEQRLRAGKLSSSNNVNVNLNPSCRVRWMSSWSRSRKSGSVTSLVCHLQKNSFFSAVPEKKREFVERMIIGYSAEQMFSVVSDVENYKNFLPWCESSTVKSRRKDHVLAELVIGMNPVTESYTSSVYLTKPTLIRAESTKGRFFSKMLTFWRFSPGLKGKPQTCVIDFYVSLEFRSVLHANIANVFFNEVVKAMTGAFYEEAKRRYGPAACPSRKIVVTKADNDL